MITRITLFSHMITHRYNIIYVLYTVHVHYDKPNNPDNPDNPDNPLYII